MKRRALTPSELSWRVDGLSEPDKKRLFEKLSQPLYEPGCSLWNGAGARAKRKGAKHGTVRWKGKNVAAHRLFYSIFVGPIPDGMNILHKCSVDNEGRCVQPLHLSAGTKTENSIDMVMAGNQRHQKLTADQVKEIRAIYASENRPTQRELARRYGVSTSQMSDVLSGFCWNWL